MARKMGRVSASWQRGAPDPEAFWRQTVAAWAGSRESQVAFCRERGLSRSALHWWKGELARRDAGRARRDGEARGGEARAAARRAGVRQGPAFVPLRVVGSERGSGAVGAAGEASGVGGVEVVLGSGRRVRVVAVLEGLGC